MPGLSEASWALKSAMVVSPLALIITIVGMASPYWLSLEGTEGNIGIWQVCVKGLRSPNLNCVSFYYLSKVGGPYAFPDPDFVKATEAMEVLACLAGGAAVLLVFACALVECVGRNKMSHVLAMILNFVAGGFAIVGVIIYSAKYVETFPPHWDVNPASFLSWAFALCIVGSAGFLITGCILVLDVRRKGYMYSPPPL